MMFLHTLRLAGDLSFYYAFAGFFAASFGGTPMPLVLVWPALCFGLASCFEGSVRVPELLAQEMPHHQHRTEDRQQDTERGQHRHPVDERFCVLGGFLGVGDDLICRNDLGALQRFGRKEGEEPVDELQDAVEQPSHTLHHNVVQKQLQHRHDPAKVNGRRSRLCTDATGQAALYQKRNAASPFLLEVDRDVSALGVSCWPAARRSSAASLAVQLLGYLDGEGHGAAGLEAAFDELLTGSGAGDTLLCTVNAQGKLRAEPVLTPADSGAVGVQLTLSREIQQTAEAVANETMQSGCILVLDTANA